MGKREDWEEIDRLGEGGQSVVSLVRNLDRHSERAKSFDQIRSALQ